MPRKPSCFVGSPQAQQVPASDLPLPRRPGLLTGISSGVLAVLVACGGESVPGSVSDTDSDPNTPVVSSAAQPTASDVAGNRLVPSPTLPEEAPVKSICDGERCMNAAVAEGNTPMNNLLTLARSTRLPRGSNSQFPLPRNLMFADVDGDGGSEMLQYTANKLFVSQTDFEQTGMAHLYTARPITRILTGDFNNGGYDAVCPILTDGSLSCYGLSPDSTDLWWWFTQPNMVGANEDSIVADFDGDGRDDVLVYPRGAGQYRMYSVKGSAFFAPMPSFDPGNLSAVAGAGMRLRAGDFNGDGRADIMAINSAGQILYYASAWDGVRNTFWWAFTTVGGIVGSDDSVAAARIDNDSTDDIVLHNRTTGATRFLKMDYSGGRPPSVAGVSVGQISTWTNADLAVVRSGSVRDGMMSYGLDGNQMFLAGPAAPTTGLTYWWAYTQSLPRNDSGWPATQSKPWLLIKCKYKNETLEPHNNQWYRDVFQGGLPEYHREMSYGAIEMAGNTVDDTWYPLSDTAQDSRNISGSDARWQRIQRCLAASGRSRSGYMGVVAVVNAPVDSGNQGDVLLDTWDQAQNISWFAHETLHSFGLRESADDSTRKSASWSAAGDYFDVRDIMSANNILTFMDWRKVLNGPEANSLNKRKLNLVPDSRKQVLIEDPSRWITTTVRVAAINRPEANAPLFVEIRKADGTVFTIEYRVNTRLDAGLPRSTVLVHKQDASGRSVLTTDGATSGWDPERMPGRSYTISGLGTVTVDSFATRGYTAQVQVRY